MLDTAYRPLFRINSPIAEDPVRQLINRRVPWAIHGEVFSQQSLGADVWPDQGWKLHVSATPLSAVEVLERSLDVLLSEGVRFKVIGSVGLLAGFNAGVYGAPQIGKFITVYPSDDAQAVRLATSLHAKTQGLRGPRIPTDRPLCPDSLVHYRYGAMVQRWEAEAAGTEGAGRYDLLDPAGRLTDDVRLQYYFPPPPSIVDPFEVAGVYVPRAKRSTLLNGRYLVNNVLSMPPRGGVFRAVDLGAQPARLCLIKEAWHDVSLDSYGRDARDWAENEAAILSRHADDPMLPDCYGTFELNGDRYVAIEYIEGTPLDRALDQEHSPKDGLPATELVAIGLATADALLHLHEIGIVFRDFKPANVVRTPAGEYRLIDFGIAYERAVDTGPALGLGTPPFHSPAQYEGRPPSPPDDIFTWGAVLHALACGEAGREQLPKGADQFRPFARQPVREFRPSLPADLAAVIDRAVAWDEADRYGSMAEARADLEMAAENSARSLAATGGGPPASEPSQLHNQESAPPLSAADALALAREVGDALCDAAEERSGGLCWATRIEWSEQVSHSPDVYSGTAGVALYLAELARATGSDRYADAARGAARWLAGPAWGRGRAQHGLHCGEGGVAYVFLRLAELLDEPGYVTAAEIRMRRHSGADASTVDLIYGTAGTVLALNALYEATGEPEYLKEACQLGDSLITVSLPAPNDRPGRYWNVEASYAGGPVLPYLGLLHGAAGIGLAVARLAVTSREERYLDAARAAAELLLDQAVRDETGLRWPRQLGDKETGLQAHCHGAGGIAQFFLWLNRVAPDSRYLKAAEGGIQTIASQWRTDGRLAICHGLSGSGHILLDGYQALGDERYREIAAECAARIERFRPAPKEHADSTDGDAPRRGVYGMDSKGTISPDLMLGYAGAGSLLLRLARAESDPELILGQMWEQVTP